MEDTTRVCDNGFKRSFQIGIRDNTDVDMCDMSEMIEIEKRRCVAARTLPVVSGDDNE